MRGTNTGIATKAHAVDNNRFVTVQDLEVFRQQLLVDIQSILTHKAPAKSKIWLKTYQVKQMLGCSSGKLQLLRAKGIIPFSKIGHIIYYSQDDINAMLGQIKNAIEEKQRPYYKR